MTKRSDAIDRNGWDNHYAALAGKEPRYQQPVPEHRVRKPKAPSAEPFESQEQISVVEWWNLVSKSYGLPRWCLYSVPNGGVLRGDAVQRAIQMARLKKEGLRTGAPDLVLDVARGPCHGLRLELKRLTLGTQSDEQKDFAAYYAQAGYQYVLCRGAEAAIKTIKGYLG